MRLLISRPETCLKPLVPAGMFTTVSFRVVYDLETPMNTFYEHHHHSPLRELRSEPVWEERRQCREEKAGANRHA